MTVDIELTLNRFGLGKIAENKFQFLFLRFSLWKIPKKYSISFEINWKTKTPKYQFRMSIGCQLVNSPNQILINFIF